MGNCFLTLMPRTLRYLNPINMDYNERRRSLHAIFLSFYRNHGVRQYGHGRPTNGQRTNHRCKDQEHGEQKRAAEVEEVARQEKSWEGNNGRNSGNSVRRQEELEVSAQSQEEPTQTEEEEGTSSPEEVNVQESLSDHAPKVVATCRRWKYGHMLLRCTTKCKKECTK